MIRQRILESAIQLIAETSYEAVSIHDIAKEAGITAAELYNHFAGKKDILETIYTLYTEIISSERMPESEYLRVLETGGAEEIIGIFDYPLPDPIPYHFNVVKIIWARRFIDREARKVYVDNAYTDAQRYIRDVLGKGIEIGRLDMDYDEMETIAYMIHAIREFAANIAVVSPDHTQWRQIEDEMLAKLAGMIRVHDRAKPRQPVGDQRDALLADAIHCDSMTIARYYHYLSQLRRQGKQESSVILNEVIQNLMDEVDTLYVHAAEPSQELTAEGIGEMLIRHEAKKQMVTREKKEIDDPELSRIFSDIADLSAQHEKLCRRLQADLAE